MHADVHTISSTAKMADPSQKWACFKQELLCTFVCSATCKVWSPTLGVLLVPQQPPVLHSPSSPNVGMEGGRAADSLRACESWKPGVAALLTVGRCYRAGSGASGIEGGRTSATLHPAGAEGTADTSGVAAAEKAATAVARPWGKYLSLSTPNIDRTWSSSCQSLLTTCK